MECGFKENSVAVIVLHKWGKSDAQIFKLLKPLKISRKYAYRAIKPYKELWGVGDRARLGRPRCVRTKAATKIVRKRIRRNPLRKQNFLSREINISPQSMSRFIRDDLHMTAYRRSKGHLLNLTLKEIRQTRTEHLLQWHSENGHENIFFTRRENIHHRWAVQPSERQDLSSNIPWGEGESSKGAERPLPFLRHGLVWGASSGGDTSSFLQERCETGVWMYQEGVLQGVVKPLNTTVFNGQKWVFQQESAPAQNTRRLRSGCGSTFRHLSAPRIGPRGV